MRKRLQRNLLQCETIDLAHHRREKIDFEIPQGTKIE